jgi:hypothetical protein
LFAADPQVCGNEDQVFAGRKLKNPCCWLAPRRPAMWGGNMLLAALLVVLTWTPRGLGHESSAAEFEQKVKSRFDTQILAANASLRALRKHRTKTRKLGPTVLHFAGADVPEKLELAQMLTDQFAVLLQPECAHVLDRAPCFDHA